MKAKVIEIRNLLKTEQEPKRLFQKPYLIKISRNVIKLFIDLHRNAA